MRGFIAIIKARNIEFWRDRRSLTWNFLFPILLIAGFAVIFSGPGQSQFKVGFVSELDGYATRPQLFSLKYIHFIEYPDRETALKKLRSHRIDLLMDLDRRHYWVNQSSPKGYMVERLLANLDEEYQLREIESRNVRYIDWVMPGILGMNIMFSSLFGVGFAIVRYRKNGVLKRLKATPLSAFEFVAAQVVSRLMIVLMVSAMLLVGAILTLDVLVLGSFWLLLLVGLLGGGAMIALGLVMSARTRSEELSSGLLNFTAYPMMLLSGVWYSLEGAPEWLLWIANLLPLTHIVEAARLVTTSGASFVEILPHLVFLGLTTVLLLAISAFMFSWESDHR